jgi:hypothetical protein
MLNSGPKNSSGRWIAVAVIFVVACATAHLALAAVIGQPEAGEWNKSVNATLAGLCIVVIHQIARLIIQTRK